MVYNERLAWKPKPFATHKTVCGFAETTILIVGFPGGACFPHE